MELYLRVISDMYLYPMNKDVILIIIKHACLPFSYLLTKSKKVLTYGVRIKLHVTVITTSTCAKNGTQAAFRVSKMFALGIRDGSK